MLDTRDRLAQAQAQLVNALLGNAPLPDGFDAPRLRAARMALADKRARAAAQAWPDLSRQLGERFTALFAAYAAVTPPPLHGGPLADGRTFIRYLQARMELPTAAKLEALRVDLFFVRRRDGLAPRHGPVVRAALLSRPRRLILAWRLPWLGAHWLCIPLSYHRRGVSWLVSCIIRAAHTVQRSRRHAPAAADSAPSRQLTSNTIVPVSQNLSITLNGVTQFDTVGTNRTFSVTFDTGGLGVGAYTTTYSYSGNN